MRRRKIRCDRRIYPACVAYVDTANNDAGRIDEQYRIRRMIEMFRSNYNGSRTYFFQKEAKRANSKRRRGNSVP